MIALELRRDGIDARALDDIFPEQPDDDVWLHQLGQHVIVLTKDSHFRFNESELEAMVAHNIACFALTRADMSGAHQLRCFRRAWQRIERICRSNAPRPFVYTVYADGSVRLTRPARALREMLVVKRTASTPVPLGEASTD